MTPSEATHQREIFERSSVGVVEVSLDGLIQYANPQGMALLGLETYDGLRLTSLYADKDLLDEQLRDRSAGLIGNYQTKLIRQSDGTPITIHVSAIPITDSKGTVTGSFALFRYPLEEEISRIHQETAEADSVLFRVMHELHKVIAFDMVTATRYSDDMRHAQTFFSYRPNSGRGKVEWSKDWECIPPLLRTQVSDNRTLLYQDLQERLDKPEMNDLRKSPVVRALVEEGVQTCIRRPFSRKERIFASVTFYSKSPNGFAEDDRRRIEHLPIIPSVAQAIEYFDRKRDAERHKLLREVSQRPTIEGVYDAILRRLCDIFQWEHAAIYRVDHARECIKLVGACTPPRAPQIGALPYEQHISKGILGRAVRSAQPEIVGDVTLDPDYVPDAMSPDARSELCWPIALDSDSKEKPWVRWIIDVVDHRPDAFCEEEKRWLGEVALEVSGIMQRLSTLNFLSECLESTSEPLVVVDAHSRIKRANRAAASLFDVAEPKALKGNLSDLFVSRERAQEALALPDGYLGEYEVRRISAGGRVDADVSRKPLPEDIGGAIYVFKDTRPIRRALELELMEQTAYEIALESRTPLMLAISTLERSAAARQALTAESCERALRYLHRAQHAFTKLAMHNPAVRRSNGDARLIDLGAELRKMRSSLPPEMQTLVRIEDRGRAQTIGDTFQVLFALETVLMLFVLGAPEDLPVLVRVSNGEGRAIVRIEGYLPDETPLLEGKSDGTRQRGELRLAAPLISEYLARAGAEETKERLSEQKFCFSANFVAAA